MMHLLQLTTTLLISILITSHLQAETMLNIGIIHKSGIDKGLVIVNELYSTESLEGTKEIKLKLSNGLSLLLQSKYVDDPAVYGPTSTIKINGKILNTPGKVIKVFYDYVHIHEEKRIVFQDSSDQLFELQVTPNIK